MLRALDRIAPARLAIPMGIVTAAALIGLGMHAAVVALGAGIALLAGALLLSLSARWRLEGDPDPVTAGVHFEAPDQPGARWMGWACVLLGGAVLGYGAWDTVNARLMGAWDPMRGALAMTAPGIGADAPPPQTAATEAPTSTPSEAPVTKAPPAAPKTVARRTPRRERPAVRTVAAGARAAPKTTGALDTLMRRTTAADTNSPDFTRIGDIMGDGAFVNGGLGTRGAGVGGAGIGGGGTSPAPAPKPSGDYDTLITQARRQIARGNHQQAIQQLLKAQRASPKSAKPQSLLCTAYQRLGNRTKALKACKAWLRREPNSRVKPKIEAMIRKLGG